MNTMPRPLEGIKVVELATFILVPACGRILADMGADVIKIEAASGDNMRWTQATEGRPHNHRENTTMTLENANKRAVCLNVKSEAGRKILMQLLEKADIFLTNWRPDALERGKLDWNSLKEKFPRLIYGNATGYGEKGPDRDLPGFDFTSFFARGGILGSLYQKGTVPQNVVPGLGDHQAGLALSVGVLAALYRAKLTGRGEKVSTSLLHTSIYTQGIMVQSVQYPETGHSYPIDRRETTNPFVLAYKTEDDRFLQVCMPVYDHYYPVFMKAVGREDMLDHPVYAKIQTLTAQGKSPEMYDFIWKIMLTRTAAEWADIFTRADIPFSVAQTWEEVVEDKQAWATDVFTKTKFSTGAERIMVRPPVILEETPLPAYREYPLVGTDNAAVLAELGYSQEQIRALEANKDVIAWELDEKGNPLK